jgi:hypothetical protein
MSALENQPTNLNYLSPLGFRFLLDRTPNTNYFVQGATIPSINLGQALEEGTPTAIIPIPGDKLRFQPLDITFRVDEDARNYKELYDWLAGLGFPESTSQFAALVNRPNDALQFGKMQNVYSDGSLVVMTSSQNPNIRVSFQDMYPTSLSTLQFNTTDSDVQYLEATATFQYSLYNIELI